MNVFNPERKTELGVEGEDGNAVGMFNLPHLALAHELIHGLRDMLGDADSLDEIPHYFKNNKGMKRTRMAPIEELITTGLYLDNNYTDNKIRKEHGYPKRVYY